MRQAIHIILLSGGSGSRLWPLSNDARSKQFLKVLRDANGNHVSMVQRTFDQIERVVPGADVTVATCATQVRALEMQVKGHYAEVVEPERRDTAPAIMLACEHLLAEQGAGLADPVIVMPIDSYVEDTYFKKVADVALAIEANTADIVLLGVEPVYPSEKYGYIVPSESQGSPRMVERFTEKPNEVKAGLFGTVASLDSALVMFSTSCLSMDRMQAMRTSSRVMLSFQRTRSIMRWWRRRNPSPLFRMLDLGRTLVLGTRLPRRWANL